MLSFDYEKGQIEGKIKDLYSELGLKSKSQALKVFF